MIVGIISRAAPLRHGTSGGKGSRGGSVVKAARGLHGPRMDVNLLPLPSPPAPDVASPTPQKLGSGQEYCWGGGRDSPVNNVKQITKKTNI